MALFTKDNKDALEIIKEKYAAHEKAVNDAEAVLSKSLCDIDEAKSALDAAADANDVEEFEKVKAQIARLENAAEMAQMRLDKLKASAPASKVEIDTAIAGYQKQIADLDTAASEAITSHMTELKQIVDDCEGKARILSKKMMELQRLSGREVSRSDRQIELIGGKYLTASRFAYGRIRIGENINFGRSRI